VVRASFLSQQQHGIRAHRLPRWSPRCNDGRKAEYGEDDGPREWIGDRDTVLQ
jgi:hypothetical protein